MAIELVTMYEYRCDNCREVFDTGEGGTCWKEPNDIAPWMEHDEWWKQIGNGWYCGNCYTFDEDKDDYVVQSIRK